MDARTKQQMTIWLATGCLLIFVMVMIGGITRLTGSGLSMVTWKPVTGVLPPLSEEAWQEAFKAYQQFPEFRIRNFDFTLTDFKSIYWWEYIHRNMGRLIGLVFIVPFLYFYRLKKLDGVLLKKLLILFGLGAFQGFLGWYMVKSGLEHEPHVSHFRLAAHLITALLSFSYAFWLMLDLHPSSEDLPLASRNKLGRLGLGLLVVLGLQIMYGAFVAGLKAGAIYNTWPLMGDRFMAEGVTAMRPLWENFVNGPAGVQFVHRSLAYVVAGFVVWIFVCVRKKNTSSIRRSAMWMLAVVLLQFVLGVCTLLAAVPLWLGLLHQAGAFLLLSVVLYYLHRVRAFQPRLHPST